MPRWDGMAVSFMRARGAGARPRASTHHYHPRHLLYHRESHWHCGTYDDIVRRLRRQLDAPSRAGLDAILAGDARRREPVALAFVAWVEQEGERHGIRIPNASERARSTGRGDYIANLGLGQREVFDLVGNHFDADALIVRLAGPMRGWLRGDRPRHHYLHPEPLLRVFGRTRAWVLQRGVPAQGCPFPHDLRAALVTAGAWRGCAAEGTNTSAAEDGRAAG